MTLAIDASSPAVAKTASGGASTGSITTASFTPPSNSLLVVSVFSDGGSVEAITWTITDSLGTHLTYTARQVSSPGTSARSGGTAIYTAPVSSSAAMTITATGSDNGAAVGCVVAVVTDGGSLPRVGTSTQGGLPGGTSQSASFTATQTGSWGFAAVESWNVGDIPSAGTGCSAVGSGSAGPNTGGSDVDFGLYRRTTADGTNGSSTTLAWTFVSAQSTGNYALVEILPAAGGAVNPAITQLVNAYRRRVNLPPRRELGLRARAVLPVPAQVNPPWQPVTVRGLKRPEAPRRRPVTATPVRAQVNPPIDQTVTARVRRFTFARRRGAITPQPIPTQQSALVNPTITQTTTGRVRRLAQVLRRPAIVPQSVPIQVTVPTRRVRRLAQVLRRPSAVPQPVPIHATIPAVTRSTVGRPRRLGAVMRRGAGSPITPGNLSLSDTDTGTFLDSGALPGARTLVSTLDAIATNNTRPTTANSNITGDANNTGPNFFASTDIAAPHSGTTVQKYSLSGTSVQSIAYWDPAKWSATPAGLTYYVRFYVYISSLPNATSALAGETTSAFSSKNLIRLTSAGKLTITNGGTLAGTSTSTVPTGQWVRIEAQIFHDSTNGQIVLRYYSSAESTTITETLTGTVGNTQGASGTSAVERVFLGNNGGADTTGTRYYADAVWSDSNWIGPAVQAITDGDTGTGTDALSALALSQGDTGSGTDTGTVGGTPISAGDTGTGTDAVAALSATLTASETGTGVDARAAQLVTLTASETGALAETALVTRTFTDSDTGVFRDTCSLVKWGTFFTPPSTQEHNKFHGRVTRVQDVGISVLKTGASYALVSDAMASQWQSADIIYLGGRSYQVDPTEAAALTAAGYGAYVSLQVITG